MKKNPIDLLVTEWAYRCEKGYPNINNKEDKKVLDTIMKEWALQEQEEEISTAQIKALIDANKDSPKLLNRVYRTLKASVHIEALKEKLNSVGISKDLFDGRNLHDELISILQKGEKSEVETFIRLVGKDSLPDRGNLEDEIKSLDRVKINKIVGLTGAKGGVTIGKGEILLPLLYSDVKLKTDGAGDFTVNGKTAELKSNSARLSGYRVDVPYSPVNKLEKTTWTAGLNGDVAESREKRNTEEVIKNINSFINSTYKHTQLQIQEKDLGKVVQFLAIAAVDSYIKEKNIEVYIILDNKTLDFRVFSPAEDILRAMEAGEIKYSPKTHPQLPKDNII